MKERILLFRRVLPLLLAAAMLVGMTGCNGAGTASEALSGASSTAAAESSTVSSSSVSTEAEAEGSSAAVESSAPIESNAPVESSAAPETSVAVAEPEPENTPLFTVCIDPGHGGKDGGSTYGDRREATDNLAFALKLRDVLEAQNIGVIMTREDDTYVELETRCAISNDAKVDYFVSIHRNCDNQGRGVETWVSPFRSEESRHLAETIQSELAGVGIQKDRGVRGDAQSGFESSLYVLHYSAATSALVELGFIDNEEDNRLLDENSDAYAAAIAQSLLDTYDAYHGEGAQAKDKADASTSAESDVLPVVND